MKKKVFVAILAALMLGGAVTVVNALDIAPDPYPADGVLVINPIGDTTLDGKVNNKDLSKLKAHVNESSPLAGYALGCGDVTGDGKVNNKDLSRLKAHVNESNPLW